MYNLLLQMPIFLVSLTATGRSKEWCWGFSHPTSTGLAATVPKVCVKYITCMKYSVFVFNLYIVSQINSISLSLFKAIPEKQVSCSQCGTSTETLCPQREFHTKLVIETNQEEIKEVQRIHIYYILFG